MSSESESESESEKNTNEQKSSSKPNHPRNPFPNPSGDSGTRGSYTSDSRTPVSARLFPRGSANKQGPQADERPIRLSYLFAQQDRTKKTFDSFGKSFTSHDGGVYEFVEALIDVEGIGELNHKDFTKYSWTRTVNAAVAITHRDIVHGNGSYHVRRRKGWLYRSLCERLAARLAKDEEKGKKGLKRKREHDPKMKRKRVYTALYSIGICCILFGPVRIYGFRCLYLWIKWGTWYHQRIAFLVFQTGDKWLTGEALFFLGMGPEDFHVPKWLSSEFKNLKIYQIVLLRQKGIRRYRSWTYLDGVPGPCPAFGQYVFLGEGSLSWGDNDGNDLFSDRKSVV